MYKIIYTSWEPWDILPLMFRRPAEDWKTLRVFVIIYKGNCLKCQILELSQGT
jgi:hypothetical protein